MGRIERRQQANLDLYDIWEHIARENSAAADNVIRRIHRTLQKLADMPGLGRTRRELAPNLRSFVVMQFVVYYVPLIDGIEVVRVLHSRQDVDDAFGFESDE